MGPLTGAFFHGESVVEGVEVLRHDNDVVMRPPQPGEFLPALNLGLKSGPVPGKPFVAPVHLGIVAGDAMRGVQHLAPRSALNRVGVGFSKGGKQDPQYDAL